MKCSICGSLHVRACVCGVAWNMVAEMRDLSPSGNRMCLENGKDVRK